MDRACYRTVAIDALLPRVRLIGYPPPARSQRAGALISRTLRYRNTPPS
jgi:hypothetical protein